MLVLDNCMWDSIPTNAFQDIRQLGLLVVVTTQYQMVDKMVIYQKYLQNTSITFDCFCSCLDACVGEYEALVIDRSCKSDWLDLVHSKRQWAIPPWLDHGVHNGYDRT